MSMYVRDRSDVESLTSLNSSSKAFKSGNEQAGFQHFNAAKYGHQERVYEQIAVNLGMPTENPNYGRELFYGSNKGTLTNEARSRAINTYLRAIIQEQVSHCHDDHTEMRWENKTRWERNLYTGRTEPITERERIRVVDWSKLFDNIRILFPPKPYDPDAETKWLGIGIGVVGSVAIISLVCFLTPKK